MRISDWSSDVCSSDLGWLGNPPGAAAGPSGQGGAVHDRASAGSGVDPHHRLSAGEAAGRRGLSRSAGGAGMMRTVRTIFGALLIAICAIAFAPSAQAAGPRSEEHTSELQPLMRTSYAVFCLKTK